MELSKRLLGVQEVSVSVLETSAGSPFRIFSAPQVDIRIVSSLFYCSLSNSPCTYFHVPIRQIRIVVKTPMIIQWVALLFRICVISEVESGQIGLSR